MSEFNDRCHMHVRTYACARVPRDRRASERKSLRAITIESVGVTPAPWLKTLTRCIDHDISIHELGHRVFSGDLIIKMSTVCYSIHAHLKCRSFTRTRARACSLASTDERRNWCIPGESEILISGFRSSALELRPRERTPTQYFNSGAHISTNMRPIFAKIEDYSMLTQHVYRFLSSNLISTRMNFFARPTAIENKTLKVFA